MHRTTNAWRAVVPIGALVAAVVLAACSILIDVDSYAVGGVDAGTLEDVAVRRDAREGGDAGKPGPSALMVSSGTGVQTWCVVLADGDVECWGNNEFGQLGDGTTNASATPVRVLGLPGPVSEVSVGSGSPCALVRRAWQRVADLGARADTRDRHHRCDLCRRRPGIRVRFDRAEHPVLGFRVECQLGDGACASASSLDR